MTIFDSLRAQLWAGDGHRQDRPDLRLGHRPTPAVDPRAAVRRGHGAAGAGGVGLVRVGLVAVAVALVASLAAGLSQHHGRGVVLVVVAPAVVLALMIGSVTGPPRLRVGRAPR